MASTIDQLKSLFQKAKKKTLDATTIDERLGQGLRSVGDRAFNAARVTDNRLRNNLQQNAGTRSYGQAFGKSFLDTPQTMYDSLQKTGITKPFGNLVRSTVTPLSAGAGNYFQGVNTATTAQGGLAKLKGGLQALKGGGQVAAGINPLTYAATSANTLLPQGVTKRLLTGGLRGFTQTGINPETEAKNINTPLGSFDPVMGIGEMVGFVKNPINAKLFKGTEKLLPTAQKTVGKWLGSNSIRGAIEQIALDLPEMPDNMNAGQKAEWLAKTIGIGAVSELVGQGVMQGSGKVLKKVGDTKLGKVTQEQASKLFDYLATARRRNTIPVRRSLTETVPMWREKLSIKRTNTPEDKRVLSQMGYGSQSAAGGLAGAEPYQDENGNWKMRFNPEKAALGIAAMGGIKAIKNGKLSIDPSAKVGGEAKYSGSFNLNNPDDAKYLSRIFSPDQIEQFKQGKFEHWRGGGKEYFEQIAHGNIISDAFIKPKLTYKPMKQGEIREVFHGTAIENLPKIKQKGLLPGSQAPGAKLGGGYGQAQSTISTSTDPNIAGTFTGGSSRGAVIRLEVADTAKIVKADIEDAVELETHLKQLKNEKVDAVYIGGGEKEVVVLNPKILTPQAKRVFDVYNSGGKISKMPEEAYGMMGGIEPVYDEDGKLVGVKFNPQNAMLGMAAMGGIKAIKGNKAVFGNMKPVEFDGKYTSGDISKLTKSLDEALGTESFNGKGKWTSEFAARGSAKKSLEFDATQSPEAKQLLDYVNGLEQQIAQAQGAKNTYTFKVKGGSPTTQTVTTPQGKKLTIKTEPLAQSPATLKVIGSDKTLPVTPNLQQTPRVTQQAPTSQLDAQLRPTSSPDVRTTARPTVQAQSWKKLSSDKLYSQETADARIADAFDAEMNAPQDFKQSFARFIGNKDAARTRGTDFASQEVFTRVPKEKAEAVIRVLDGDVTDATPEVKAMAAPFRKAYDQLIKNAQESGIPIRYWKEYIPHFWKEDPQEVMQMFMTAKGKFANAKTRTIPTYSEGIAMGLTPQYTHPAQILEQYVQGLERVKAGMNFIKELDSKGIIVPASVGRNRQGFKQVIAPGIGTNETAILDKVFVGNFYAPAKVADQLNKLFTEQEPSALAGLANATGKFQDIYLSGGVPGTPINAFTFGQAIKETTAGRPVAATKAVVRSFFPGATNKYFREKAPVIEAMQRNNIPIQTTLSVDELIDAPTAKRTFGEKVGRVWSKVVNEATFKRFMPSLQVDMFDSVQKGALKAGKSATEAEQLAAKTVKQFYGVTDSATLAARSPLVKDAMTSALFAPRFRESMLNFWANNAKALRHPFAPENKYNMRFLVGLGLTYAGYDALNYANTGNHLWENPEFKKDKALIPLDDGTTVGVPLLPSVAYLPRTMYSVGESLLGADFAGATGEAMGLISPLAKPVADLVRNKDYFGKQIIPYDAEGIDRWKAAGTHLATQYSGHPYVRELFDPRNQEDPAYQRISRAMEAPLRFYDSKLNGSIKVKAADTSTMSRVEAVKAEKERFDTLGKLLDKYENNPEKALKKAQEQGFSAEDVQYYDIAREENDIKTAYVLDTLDSVDDKDMIKTLEGMRKKVGDKLILADGVIDDLYDQDLITSAQKKYLKSLDYEKGKDGKYTLKKGSGKGKKIKIGSTPTLKKISVKAPQVAQMAKIDFKIPTSQRVPIRKASTSKPRIKLKDASKRLLSVVR